MKIFKLVLLSVATAAILSSCHNYSALDADPVKPNPRPNREMQQVLDTLAMLAPKPIETLNAVEARRQPTATDAVLTLLQKKGDAAPKKLPPVGKVEDLSFASSDGTQLPLRVYTPSGKGPFPMIVYFHGGGWVIATIDTYDSSARALSNLSEAIVVAVEYRKAPEYKFPTAHEDCYAALQYVFQNASRFSGDAKRVAVVGESAGGNMATAMSLMASERGGKQPLYQGLIYPVTDYGSETSSYSINAHAKPLNAAMMRWFFSQYVKSNQDGNSVLLSPLRASESQLRNMPPTTVITASIDPLQTEGQQYAERLQRAGIPVIYKNFEGVSHEFFGMAAVLEEAQEAQALLSSNLKSAFAKAK